MLGVRFSRRAGPARLLPLLTVLWALALPGCGPEAPDFLKSAGAIRTEYRPLPAFNAVEVNDNLRVVIAADGQAPAVEVTAGRNLLPEIVTEVDATGKLVLRNDNTWNWVRSFKHPITVTVHVADPSRTFTIYHYGGATVSTASPATRLDTVFLHLVGPGDADLDLTSHRIWLDQYEYGDVTLRGQTHALVATVGGVGWLRAQGLQAQDVSAISLRDGQVYARSNDVLTLVLHGRGNAYYYGEPTRKDFHELAEGRIIKAE